MLGAPVLSADVSADRPNAFLVARLSLVAPDGAATRISYGVLNLTHRDSHAEPSPLVPGSATGLQLKLNDVGQAVPAGHRLRLALTQRLLADDLALAADDLRHALCQARAGSSCRSGRLARKTRICGRSSHRRAARRSQTVATRPPSRERRAEIDLTGGRLTVVSFKDRGAERIVESGIEIDNEGLETYSIAADDPLSARAEMRWTQPASRGRLERPHGIDDRPDRDRAAPFSSPPASTPTKARRAFSAARGRSKSRAISSDLRNGRPASAILENGVAGASFLIWNRIVQQPGAP